jgi:2-hydroxychromene-2-carboxylate isomerase
VKRGPRLYFSFRSPYTWLAVERLRRSLPDIHRWLEFIPYWDPDGQTEQALRARGSGFHYVQMSKAKHRYMLYDTRRLTQRLGLSVAWPVDVSPWWEVPHLAWLKARELGLAEPFFDAVMAARWGSGQDVCNLDVVRALGTSIGADGDVLAAAAQDPRMRAAGVACLADAYDDDIFGVPYFRIGRHRFWGYDRVDDFLEVFQATVAGASWADDEGAGKAGSGWPPSPYDVDTTGGCG